MEIVVHGTKGGYKTKLFSTSNRPLSFGDVRNGVNTEYSVGQSLYAIEFLNDGYVFTKYIIVRDSLRSFATGNIAFSLVINSNKELSRKGADVFALLENLSNHYKSNYIKENNINNGETSLIQEDWGFVNTFLSEYIENDKIQKDEEFKSGTKESAFIYYKDENELKEYLDKPIQEEYRDFKQVFFININLKGSQNNPLNILSNSGIELKDIDLKNEYYYLNNYNRSKGITIIANGKDRSDGKNNNSIRAKWQVEINYSKDERCFEPIQAKGTLSNPDSDIYHYLEVKNNQLSIKYNEFNNPKPKIKTKSIEIKDRKGKFIEDAEIQIGMRPWEKIQGHSFSCIFKGTEIINKYNVLVKKDCYSGVYNDFVPEKATDITTINLEERNIIPINVFDEENTDVKIEDFEVWTKLTNGYKKTNQLEFINEQILDSYTITIRKNGYNDKIIHDFHPYQQNEIKTTLLKSSEKQTENYKVSAGNHGRLKNNQSYSSNRADGSDVMYTIVNSKGYKFTHFLKEEDTLIAQYEEEKYNFKKPIFILGIAFVSILICLGIWFKISPKPEETSVQVTNFSKIQNYIDGDSLLPHKLEIYRNEWNSQKPEIHEKSRSFWEWLKGEAPKNDSTEYNDWDNNMKNIDLAISKRDLLKNKKIKKLITLEYSSKQQNFLKAIKEIDSIKLIDICKDYRKINNKTLSEIALDIKSALKPKEPIIKKPQESHEETVGKENKIEPTNPVIEKQKPTKPTNVKPVKSVKPADIVTSDNNKNSEIESKLKSSSISISELNKLKEQNTKYIKSIQLYIDFFEKVKTSDQKQDFDNLLDNIKRDPVLGNSALKTYLKSICASSESFDVLNSKKGRKNCKSLDALKK